MTDDKSGFVPLDSSYSTRSIHEAQSPDQWNSRAVIPPITLSTIFKLSHAPDYPDHNAKMYRYSRLSNPNREILEKLIASLDDAKYGICYPSGMASIANMLQILRHGEHVLCARDIYGGTSALLETLSKDQELQFSYFNSQDLSTLEKEILPNTKLVWVESMSNPLLNLIDLKNVSEICHKRSPDILVAVDNTLMTSYFQKPLNLGADVVMNSVTKYMNGHSDVIMGSLVLNNDKVYARLRHLHYFLGSVPSSIDCYFVTRGLKTLSIRMRQHMINSLEVAKFLENHPQVEKVIHPGLPSYPQQELLKSQYSGWSGMLSFYIKDANIKNSVKFLQSLKVFTFAGSLGDVESLAAVPALQSHAVVSAEKRKEMGVTDNFIRLSVGIEDAEDLKKDLDQALNTVSEQLEQ